MIQDRWKTPTQFPGVKERRPIDIWNQFIQRLIPDDAQAGKTRNRDLRHLPIDRHPTFSSGLKRDQALFFHPVLEVVSKPILLVDVLFDECRFKIPTDER